MKVKPRKFNEDQLYRHPDYAPAPQEGQPLVKSDPHRTPSRPNQILRTRTEHLTHSTTAESADFDDEFDGNLFDGVEVSEDHGETTFDSTSSDTPVMRPNEAPRPGSVTHGTNSGRNTPGPNNGQPQPPAPRPSGPIGRGQGPPQQYQPNQGRPQPNGPNGPNGPNQRAPQTPQQPRPDPARRMPPPANDVQKAPAAQQQNGQQPQQQPRLTPPQIQQANQPRPGPQAPGNAAPTNAVPNPTVPPSVGFVTSRAAEQIQNANSAAAMTNIAFNPNVESPVPKDKRTPGLDHNRSVPVKRKEGDAPPIPPPQGLGRPANSGAGFNRPSNFANPQGDANRRIGMPGGPGYAMSPSANRGAYKPPTFANPAAPNALKRERVALQDVSNSGANGVAADGGDAKRQRVEVPGVENAAAPATST